MKTPKIINDEHVQWHNEDKSRLSYEMIFREAGLEEEQEEDPRDKLSIEEVLENKDQEWQLKLEEARKKAYNQGLEDGLQEGLEEARLEIDNKLERLEEQFLQAHSEWKERQRIMETGILDLVFDISETILGMPVENPAIRENLDQELAALLQKVDEQTKPLLLVSEEDYEYVKRVKDRVAPVITVIIKPDKNCKPGEFILETNHETVVHKFQIMLGDFKDSLSLPTWKK